MYEFNLLIVYKYDSKMCISSTEKKDGGRIQKCDKLMLSIFPHFAMRCQGQHLVSSCPYTPASSTISVILITIDV